MIRCDSLLRYRPICGHPCLFCWRFASLVIAFLAPGPQGILFAAWKPKYIECSYAGQIDLSIPQSLFNTLTASVITYGAPHSVKIELQLQIVVLYVISYY